MSGRAHGAPRGRPGRADRAEARCPASSHEDRVRAAPARLKQGQCRQVGDRRQQRDVYAHRPGQLRERLAVLNDRRPEQRRGVEVPLLDGPAECRRMHLRRQDPCGWPLSGARGGGERGPRPLATSARGEAGHPARPDDGRAPGRPHPSSHRPPHRSASAWSRASDATVGSVCVSRSSRATACATACSITGRAFPGTGASRSTD